MGKQSAFSHFSQRIGNNIRYNIVDERAFTRQIIKVVNYLNTVSVIALKNMSNNIPRPLASMLLLLIGMIEFVSTVEWKL